MSYQPQQYVKTTITEATQTPEETVYTQNPPYYPLNESSSGYKSTQPLYPSIPIQPSGQVYSRTYTKSYTTPVYQPTNLPVDQVNVKANNNTGYTASGLPVDRIEPTQVNYKSYNKSYTAGYEPTTIPVDQINTKANNNYGYTPSGLPIDRVEFGSRTDKYKSTEPSDQFSSAGRNLKGALARLGHAIGDFGHGVSSAIDRWSDEISDNRGVPKQPKTNATEVKQTTEVRQVTQPSQY